jgi:hypothetical protein
MRRMNRRAVLLIVSMATGCAKAGSLTLSQMPDVDMNVAMGHIKVLSSDEYEGRAPGTKGEELTVAYLIDQFKKIGLKPGNTDGTYVQKVPLVGITPAPAPLVVSKGSKQLTLK